MIKIEIHNHVGTITLNRPDVRNAFNPQMISELTTAFRNVSVDSNVRVVRLQGEGKSFCAGADLEWMKSMAQFSQQENLRDSDQLFEMFQVARNCVKPVIGIAQGHVMGGGLGLAAICDYFVSEEPTKFCFSEVKLGLVPAVICSFVLERMNPTRARQVMLTGDLFTAQQALEWGLCSFVGTASACQAEVQRLTQNLLQAAPEAVMATKRLLQYVTDHPGSPQVRNTSTQVIAERRVSKEGQEGLTSFFENRKPKWVVQS